MHSSVGVFGSILTPHKFASSLLMLTFSDVVERPLVVFEEGVLFDFLYAVSAQSPLP